MAMGRPAKPHICSWNDPVTGRQEVVAGLYHCPDDRWRINVTGQKYTEPDERRAVQRFKDWQAKNAPPTTIGIEGAYTPSPMAIEPVTSVNGVTLPEAIVWTFASDVHLEDLPIEAKTTYQMPEQIIWDWLREQLIKNPQHVALKTGIPEVARLGLLAKPPEPIRLERLIEVYKNDNGSDPKAKKRCEQIFRQLMKFCDAKMLEDLTTPKLLEYKKSIDESASIGSADTKAWMYGRIKSIIAFGKKCGLDSTAIDAALSRCEVLCTKDKKTDANPTPISREDFHKLLKTGGKEWRAWLLVSLNLALKFQEACNLKWEKIDIIKGTHSQRRDKTNVPRAAVLWQETIGAIKDLPRKSGYVFTSRLGTKYKSINSRCNEFAELRIKADVSADVSWDDLRDGAYTAAINDKTVEERFTRILVGHKSPGLQDNYVLRNPQKTKEACDAVYREYGPFPE